MPLASRLVRYEKALGQVAEITFTAPGSCKDDAVILAFINKIVMEALDEAPSTIQKGDADAI